jgi:DNA invertase Pin-like site-specific DNA recombinase
MRRVWQTLSRLSIDRLDDSMQIGYIRVSKADGSQSTDLQRDALRAAGVATRRLYEDRDLRHLFNVIHDLSTRSIGFKVLTGHRASIDTTTPAGGVRHFRRARGIRGAT